MNKFLKKKKAHTGFLQKNCVFPQNRRDHLRFLQRHGGQGRKVVRIFGRTDFADFLLRS